MKIGESEVKSGSAQPDDSKTAKSSSRFVLISMMVAHFVSLLLPAFIIYTAWPGNYLFAWHPILMTIAFPLLFYQGICVFSPESSLLKNYNRPIKIQAHWIVQTSGVVCAIAGFAVIYYNKYAHDKPHFTSWHGLMGLITVCYAATQTLGGVVLKYASFVTFIKRVTLKQIHATSGLFAFLLASITLFLGFQSNWFNKNTVAVQWYACVSCMAVLLLAVMNQVVTAYGGRSPVVK